MSKYINVIFCKILSRLGPHLSHFMDTEWIFCCYVIMFSIAAVFPRLRHYISVSFNMDRMFIQYLLHVNKNALLLRLIWGKAGARMIRHAYKKLQNGIYRLKFVIKQTCPSARCLCPLCSAMFLTPCCARDWTQTRRSARNTRRVAS